MRGDRAAAVAVGILLAVAAWLALPRGGASVVPFGGDERGSVPPPPAAAPGPPPSAPPPSPAPTRAPGLVLKGRVVFPDGTPAAGAEYEAVPEDGDGTIRDRFGPVPTADDDGAFRVEGLDPGRYAILVSARRGGRTVLGRAVAEAGTRGLVVTLVDEARAAAGLDLPPETLLVARVSGPDGRPLSSGFVAFWHVHDDGTADVESRLMDEGRSGETVDPARDTEIWIEVCLAYDADGTALGSVLHGPVPPAAGEVEVRVPADRAVEGVVRDPDGRPVAGVKVALKAERPGLPWRSETSIFADPDAVPTDALGRFRVGALEDAAYLVRLREVPKPYLVPAAVEARPGGPPVDVRLEAGASARVLVLDEDGRPVEGATVTTFRRDEEDGGRAAEEDASTDASGVAVFEGLVPDVPRILDVDPPAGTGHLLRVREVPWDTGDATVRLGRAAEVEVLVQDPSGRPVPDATIWWSSSPDLSDAREARTDARGICRIGRAYAPEMVYDAEGAAKTTLARPSGRVVLTVDAGEAVEVRIRGWPGEEYVRTRLFRAGMDGPASGFARADGTVRFCGLRHGASYGLYVGPLEDGRCLLLEGLVPGMPAREASLVPGRTVAGTVRQPEGTERKTVSWMVGGVQVAWTDVGEDGGFALEGIPEGSWTFQAWTWRGGRTLRGRAESTGERPVEIEIR